MKKTITKEFYNKIAREQGVLDTKTYRYAIINQSTVERIRREHLDTTAALRSEGNWETLTVK